LGDIEIAEMASTLARQKPFIPEPRCRVQRPAWSLQSSRKPPATGEDTPETWEHSIEVQLPFLQRTQKDFKLVPVIFGQADPAHAARVLAGQLDDRLLLIASSDLSHYHPYSQATDLDQQCVRDICDLNLAAMKDREACGKMPILTVMHLARLKGWKTRLLDYRNSGDTAGDKSGVVGYAAIAFFDPAQAAEAWMAAEKRRLLAWARQSLQACVTGGQNPSISASDWPAKFQTPKGCFVTLTKKNQLRGCIGHIFPQESLLDAIADNARSAALRDPRFPPVTPAELKDINIEISVLTTPQPLAFTNATDLLAKLRPHIDGVVLKISSRGATYLPQVWEQIPEPTQFLNHLAEKAGCEPAAWRQPGTEILVYQVEAFKEANEALPQTDR
jgi:AmmeMemoRadiSam system protein A